MKTNIVVMDATYSRNSVNTQLHIWSIHFPKQRHDKNIIIIHVPNLDSIKNINKSGE